MPIDHKATLVSVPAATISLVSVCDLRKSGKNGCHSCSPRPKSMTVTRTMPTVRLMARKWARRFCVDSFIQVSADWVHPYDLFIDRQAPRLAACRPPLLPSPFGRGVGGEGERLVVA